MRICSFIAFLRVLACSFASLAFIALKRPEVQEKLITLGEFAAQLKVELEKWAKVIKIAKVTVE